MVDPPEPLDGLARSPGDGKRVKNCELRDFVMAFNLKAELIDPKIHTFWLILLLFVFFVVVVRIQFLKLSETCSICS